MKIERWEEENDEEWTERLAEEIALANDPEASLYFVERYPLDEKYVIINYIDKDGWTWKEHPEGPFSARQIIKWKNKAEGWDNYLESIKDTIPHVSLADYEVLEDKLEAVKEALNEWDTRMDHGPYPRMRGDDPAFHKIKEILQSSTQTARDP